MKLENPLPILFRKASTNKLDWIMISVFGLGAAVMIMGVVGGFIHITF